MAKYLGVDGRSQRGAEIEGESVIVAPTANGAPGRSKQLEYQSDNENDDPERPEDRYGQNKS